MNLTLSQCFVIVHDPDLALAFYRDTLGLELRNDVAKGDFRWITVGAASQPDVAIVLTNYLNGSPADSDAVAALSPRAPSTASTSTATTSTPPSRSCAPRTPRSCRSRPTSRGARGTAPCAIRPAT